MNKYFVAYYKKNMSDIDTYRRLPTRMSRRKFNDNFVYLMAVPAESLEEVYHNMQGEIWSPHGEAREIIRALGVGHTSMSMGDIVHHPLSNQYWFVNRFGFTKVHLTE